MKEVGVRLKVGATGLENIRDLSKELDAAGVSTTALDGKAAELAAELKRLASEQALIDAFKKQKQAVADAAAAMEAAKSKASELGREIGATEAPTKKQEAAFAKARAAAREASDAYTAQRVKLQDLRGGMAEAGVSTDSLAAAQLRVNKQLQGVRADLSATADWARRLAEAERAAAEGAGALTSAATKAAGATREQGQAAQAAGSDLQAMGDKLRGLASIGVAGILGSQTTQLLKGVAETADQFANLQARVRLATGEGPAFTAAMEGIAEVALRTSSSLDATAQLFTKLTQAGKQMGVGQEQALALTESVNQAVQLSGASATASEAAITQLVQGLQGGVLRGDEFNSVMEQAPRLAQALADGLGVTTGELRKMAEAGQLSSEVVIKALQSQAGVLKQEFGALPATIGRAIENLQTKWALFVGGLNSSSGATASVAAGINALADNLESLVQVAGRAGTVVAAALAVQAVGALRAFATELAASGKAANLLTADLNKIPKLINVAVAVTGFEVGFQIGQMLYDNSALARKLGVAVTEFFTALVSDLQFVAEAAKAVFTDDTIGAAFDRYKQRAEEQRAIFQGLYDDAEKSPDVVRAAAAAAAAETQGLGDKATAAGAQVAAAGQAGAAGLAATTGAAAGAGAAVQGVGSAATGASQAIGTLAEAAKVAGRAQAQSGADATLQAQALVRVALAGEQAAQALGLQIPQAIAKLSGPELEIFRAGLTQALAQAKDEAKRLATELQAAGKSGGDALAQADRAGRLLNKVLVEVGLQAAKSLGVEVVQSVGMVSDEFARSADNLSVLIRSLPALERSGVDTGATVSRALAKMIDGAKTQAEIDQVTLRLQAMGRQGQLSGAQVAAGMDKARERAKALRQEIEDATPGIQSTEEAARRMGVKTRAELDATAKKFREAWDAIRDSTEFTMAEKIKAFARFREAAIEANGGVESSEVALQRRTLELAADAAGLGDAFDKSMSKAAKATDAATAAGDRYIKALDGMLKAQIELDKYGPGANGSGAPANLGRTQAEIDAKNAAVVSVLGPSGSTAVPTGANGKFQSGSGDGTVISTGQLTPPTDDGMWEISTTSSNRVTGQSNVESGLRGYWWTRTPAGVAADFAKGQAESAASLAARGGPQFNGGRGTSVFGPTQSASSASASSNHYVTVDLGGRITQIAVATSADGAALAALLKQLEDDFRRSG